MVTEKFVTQLYCVAIDFNKTGCLIHMVTDEVQDTMTCSVVMCGQELRKVVVMCGKKHKLKEAKKVLEEGSPDHHTTSPLSQINKFRFSMGFMNIANSVTGYLS